MSNDIPQESDNSSNFSSGFRRPSNFSSTTSGFQALCLDATSTAAPGPPPLLNVQGPSPNTIYSPAIFPAYDTTFTPNQASDLRDQSEDETYITGPSRIPDDPTPGQSSLWPPKDFQLPQGSNNQLRRSQSQPFVANTQPRYWGQGDQRHQVDMSTSTQTLPSPITRFEHGQDHVTSSGYSSLSGYGNMSTLLRQPYLSSMGEGRSLNLSPRALSSTPAHGQGLSRSTKAPSRSPPLRERTPIRHHRPSASRAHSGSRPDILLAYATEQQQQRRPSYILPSQSAPSTPPSYPSALVTPVTTTALPKQPAYYGVPWTSQIGRQYLPTQSPYLGDPSQQSEYSLTRSFSQPAILDVPTINPQDSLYLSNPVQSHSPPLPSFASSLQAFPPPPHALESSPEGFRVLASRPKPQCFDHGCNGRQFSTFSNLLRHQREKSGSAMKATCPHCETEFTRTTARNGHLWGGKCKGRSGDDQSDSGTGPPSTARPE